MDLATVDRLLTTTRSVRKRLDLARPVPPETIEACLEIALQAPTGSNSQGWHFLVVTDAAQKAGLGDLYRKAFALYARRPEQPQYADGDPRSAQMPRVRNSAQYLADHLHEAPALLPIAWFTGADFKPAARVPASRVTHWNRWGGRRT
jgi:nitroreductase